MIHSLVESYARDNSQQEAFLNGAKVIVRHSAKAAISAKDSLSAFQLIVGNAGVSTAKSVAKLATKNAGKSVIQFLMDRGGVAYLSNNTSLWLYQIYEGEIKTEFYQLFYQCLDGNGNVLISTFLNPVIQIN